jgi:hypothetical protein
VVVVGCCADDGALEGVSGERRKERMECEERARVYGEGEERGSYSLAVFGEVDGGVVWRENIVRCSDYWAGHFGGCLRGFILGTEGSAGEKFNVEGEGEADR